VNGRTAAKVTIFSSIGQTRAAAIRPAHAEMMKNDEMQK
jgi:hypothetical protein